MLRITASPFYSVALCNYSHDSTTYSVFWKFLYSFEENLTPCKALFNWPLQALALLKYFFQYTLFHFSCEDSNLPPKFLPCELCVEQKGRPQYHPIQRWLYILLHCISSLCRVQIARDMWKFRYQNWTVVRMNNYDQWKSHSFEYIRHLISRRKIASKLLLHPARHTAPPPSLPWIMEL